jgi:hypothetical protein
MFGFLCGEETMPTGMAFEISSLPLSVLRGCIAGWSGDASEIRRNYTER